MNTTFEIHFLADKPQHIEACAAWSYGRWGVQNPNSSLQKAIEYFSKCAQKEVIPITLIATRIDGDLPVAMGSVWEQDGEEWPQYSPWIASVFTLYRYRGLGLARDIIARLEQEAKNLGVEKLYLHSGSAADLYPKLGYSKIEEKETAFNSVGKLSLFSKDLKTSCSS
jgi:GNAT superfamily N-acetyltransferase